MVPGDILDEDLTPVVATQPHNVPRSTSVSAAWDASNEISGPQTTAQHHTHLGCKAYSCEADPVETQDSQLDESFVASFQRSTVHDAVREAFTACGLGSLASTLESLLRSQAHIDELLVELNERSRASRRTINEFGDRRYKESRGSAPGDLVGTLIRRPPTGPDSSIPPPAGTPARFSAGQLKAGLLSRGESAEKDLKSQSQTPRISESSEGGASVGHMLSVSAMSAHEADKVPSIRNARPNSQGGKRLTNLAELENNYYKRIIHHVQRSATTDTLGNIFGRDCMSFSSSIASPARLTEAEDHDGTASTPPAAQGAHLEVAAAHHTRSGKGAQAAANKHISDGKHRAPGKHRSNGERHHHLPHVASNMDHHHDESGDCKDTSNEGAKQHAGDAQGESRPIQAVSEEIQDVVVKTSLDLPQDAQRQGRSCKVSARTSKFGMDWLRNKQEKTILVRGSYMGGGERHPSVETEDTVGLNHVISSWRPDAHEPPVWFLKVLGVLPTENRCWGIAVWLATLGLTAYHGAIATTSPRNLRACVADVLFGLAVLTAVMSLRWNRLDRLVGGPDQALESYAERRGFSLPWWQGSWQAACLVLLIWLCDIGRQIFTFISGLPCMAGDPEAHDYAMLIIPIVISSLFAALTYLHLHVCCVLGLMIDDFCITFFTNPDCEQGIFDWNAMQALLRQTATSIDTFLVASQTALLGALLLAASETVFGESGGEDPFGLIGKNVTVIAQPPEQGCDGPRDAIIVLLPVFPKLALLLFSFYSAAQVTEKCVRAPALVNSMALDMGALNTDLSHVVQFLHYSSAGFYVKGVYLDVTWVTKFAYVTGMASFYILTYR